MPIRYSILKCLAYFDVFNYPITREELLYFLDSDTEEQELGETLMELIDERLVFRLGPYYSLQDVPELAEKRNQGNLYAGTLLKIADRISRRLYQFPFVRGIGISGSLSKNYAEEDADIDYFIITSPNRLWIARTLMHLYKKLTFFNHRQHFYCMNYYIDGKAFEIEEKNIYTAIELLTLIPVCGNGELTGFYTANSWAATYLPQYRHRISTLDTPYGDSLLKRWSERLLDNHFGDWLDNWFCKITIRRWKQKESLDIRTAKGLTMSLKADKHSARPNPGMLQKRILDTYTQKLQDLREKWRL